MASDGKRARAGRRGATFLLAVALGITGATPASAQSKSERDMAHALMDEGDAKADAKDYDGALRAYRAAHALMNVPTTGVEVARVEALRGKLVEARRVALEVVHIAPKPGGDPPAFIAARREAEGLARDLERRVPLLRVVVRGVPEDAPIELKIDGVLVPSDQARGPHPVDPGSHTLSVASSGFPPASKVVRVAEEQRITVTLGLEETSAAGDGDASRTARRTSPLVYIGFGVGGAGLVAGTITGVLSLSRASNVDSLCPSGVCPDQQRLEQARPENDAAWALAQGSNVALGLGVVGIGVGIAGLFLSGESSPKAEQGEAATRVTLGLGSVGIEGRF